MAKGMRSKLLSKSKSLLYVLVFIVVAAGLYYLFRDNFRTREGQTASTTGPAQTASTTAPTQTSAALDSQRRTCTHAPCTNCLSDDSKSFADCREDCAPCTTGF